MAVFATAALAIGFGLIVNKGSANGVVLCSLAFSQVRRTNVILF